jgi:2-polyprenyl-3-methyl-5-hydroxy-6-metoxy-1,4-benzoquinol methylase
VKELLDYSRLSPSFFQGKACLDAGCGNGRFTYALQQLGAEVTSFDISQKAVEQCKTVSRQAYVYDVMNLRPNPAFDFVLCWGVLHHLEKPREGFAKVASQVKPKGLLLVMVYHRDTQSVYEEGRRKWAGLTREQRIAMCNEMIAKHGGNLHGWWDAFNPRYNWSFEPKEIKQWFKEEGFKKVKLTKKYNINMRGERRE